MGFHKRHIDNSLVISLFNEGGVERVINYYTGKADVLFLESGLSSDIANILNDRNLDQDKIKEEIVTRIHQELEIDEIK